MIFYKPIEKGKSIDQSSPFISIRTLVENEVNLEMKSE